MRRWGWYMIVRCVCGTVLAVLSSEASGQTEGAAQVLVRTIDRDSLVGTLVELSASRGIELVAGTGERVAVPLADLIEVRWPRTIDLRPTAVTATMPAAAEWTFATRRGERLIGTPTAGDDSVTIIRHAWLGAWPVRLDDLVWVGRPGHEGLWQRRLWTCDQQREMHDATAPLDRVELTNGDLVSGRATRLGPDGLVLVSQAVELRIGWERLSHIAFAHVPLADTPQAGGIVVLLHLADGSCVGPRQVRYDGRTFQGLAPDGIQISIPQEQVARITVRGGRWVWLSDLCPAEVRSVSMLGLDFPPLLDRNVLGGPLTIDGREYERGLGVHADCTLVYDLGGAYQQFVAQAGLDDDSGEWADVDVRVTVDGQTRFEGRHIQRDHGARPVRVNVTGAQRLELIVNAGANGDVQDRFNWADAGLVRGPRGSGPTRTMSATDAAGR